LVGLRGRSGGCRRSRGVGATGLVIRPVLGIELARAVVVAVVLVACAVVLVACAVVLGVAVRHFCLLLVMCEGYCLIPVARKSFHFFWNHCCTCRFTSKNIKFKDYCFILALVDAELHVEDYVDKKEVYRRCYEYY